MSTIIENINLNQTDMTNDADYKAFTDAYNERMRRLTEMVGQQEKQRNSDYGRQTTCAVIPSHSPYAPSSVSRQQGMVETPPPTRQEIELDRLTTENLKLKRDYAELLKKTTTLVEAYRALKTENEALTLKKNKVDAKKKTVEDTKKVFTNIGERFMTWLKT